MMYKVCIERLVQFHNNTLDFDRFSLNQKLFDISVHFYYISSM